MIIGIGNVSIGKKCTRINDKDRRPYGNPGQHIHAKTFQGAEQGLSLVTSSLFVPLFCAALSRGCCCVCFHLCDRISNVWVAGMDGPVKGQCLAFVLVVSTGCCCNVDKCRPMLEEVDISSVLLSETRWYLDDTSHTSKQGYYRSFWLHGDALVNSWVALAI